jgi:SagB-type dehydrogenase family enzyme
MSGKITQLPDPVADSGLSLEAAMALRRTVREFTKDPLTKNELSQLMWACQGITGEEGRRTAPSAGALGPLEVYAVTGESVQHYVPDGHRFELHGSGDRRAGLAAVAAEQEQVAAAPLIIVITGVLARTAWKYGGDRAWRYVNLEAGHAAQNVLLQAAALDLAGCPIGAFDDGGVQDLLELPADHRPLYLLAMGRPAA